MQVECASGKPTRLSQRYIQTPNRSLLPSEVIRTAFKHCGVGKSIPRGTILQTLKPRAWRGGCFELGRWKRPGLPKPATHPAAPRASRTRHTPTRLPTTRRPPSPALPSTVFHQFDLEGAGRGRPRKSSNLLVLLLQPPPLLFPRGDTGAGGVRSGPRQLDSPCGALFGSGDDCEAGARSQEHGRGEGGQVSRCALAGSHLVEVLGEQGILLHRRPALPGGGATSCFTIFPLLVTSTKMTIRRSRDPHRRVHLFVIA